MSDQRRIFDEYYVLFKEGSTAQQDAMQKAYEEIRASWTNLGLPDNYGFALKACYEQVMAKQERMDGAEEYEELMAIQKAWEDR